jgi:hypothetical protein
MAAGAAGATAATVSCASSGAAQHEGRRQRLQRFGGQEQRQALGQVAQFAHVAGPGVAAQQGRAGLHLRMQVRMGARAQRGQGVFQRPFGQAGYVAGALAQGRQVQAQHGQAVEQVGAEAAFADALFQVAVGGADDAHVDGDGPRAAHAHHFALFQHAQQPRLQGQRHFADFVEEEGAVVGRLEQARMAAPARAREGPFLVAEQLRLQQGLGDGAAIDGDEGRFAPRLRGLSRWMACATSSLPLPVSPWISTVAGERANSTTDWRSASIASIRRAGRAGRAARAGCRRRLCAGCGRIRAGQARHFQRVVEGAPDRGGRIHDGGQSRFLGQVGDEARADDGFHARRLQFIDLRARVFFRGVGALKDLEAEGGGIRPVPASGPGR